MPVVSFMPNIDTEAKSLRLKELLDAREAAETTLIRVIQQNRDDILRALDYACSKGVVNDEPEYEVEDESAPDGLREVNVHGLLQEVIRDFNAKQNDVISFAASGKE